MSIFSKVPTLRGKYNMFNLSHDIMQTQDIGQIMPCYLHDGILPNSYEKLSVSTLARMQALLAPLQHKVDLYIHFWYVPYRIIDKDFADFISGKMERDGETYLPPTITVFGLLYIWFAIFVNKGNALDGWTGREHTRGVFGSSSLWNYLNYPDLSEVIDQFYTEGQGQTQPVDHSTDYVGYYNTAMNIRRLQAYFYIIAQNYINENVPLRVRDEGILLANLHDYFYAYCGQNDAFLAQQRDSFSAVYTTHKNVFDSAGLSEDSAFWCWFTCKIFKFLSSINSNCAVPHAWYKDYFTSALPFTQIGDEVTLPLGNIINITDGNLSGTASSSNSSATLNNMSVKVSDALNEYGPFEVQATQPAVTQRSLGLDIYDTNDVPAGTYKVSNASGDVEYSGDVDLENVSGELEAEIGSITINELRAANALQKLKEAYARFGTRYQEWLKGFWNQNSSDRSMQLPEWLGGGRVNINISEIEQTSATQSSELVGSDSPLGTLGGKGLGVGGINIYKKHFEEPGVILGLSFLQPKAVYPSIGVDRFLTKTDNIYDYFTPTMEHLGEQEVYRNELNVFQATPTDVGNRLFGYQSRYAEYKFLPNRFRGQFANVLNFWHLGRNFNDTLSKQVYLNSDFIYIQNKDMKRPFAVQESDGEDVSNILLWYHYECYYRAKMSKFGTPALLN